MRKMFSGMTTLAFAGLLLSGVGCTPGEKKTPDGQVKGGGKKELKAVLKHDGWWCKEHGVPEEICSLCSDEAATKFKKEGDWCNLHDRAKSQCFKCDPSLYAKYEAMYTAKYGATPPRPSEEEFKK